MAAIFNALHDVARVLSEHLREGAAIADVRPGSPRDVAATTEPAARITLLSATPLPTQRNRPQARQPDGTRHSPPLVLSCLYLVTTSGADADDPVAAHNALGRILTHCHESPALQLPLSAHPDAEPGSFTNLGMGVMTIVQVPMGIDQIHKLWTSLDMRLQPAALLEVSPVQLQS